jgi:mRNA-degrading endonuclease toxin of MazEF toxin-antitoxin module
MMRRAEAWAARLNPNHGAEVGKIRPGVVIQTDLLTGAGIASVTATGFTNVISTVIVVPLTTQHRRGAEACVCAFAPETGYFAIAGQWRNNPGRLIASGLARDR